MSQLNTKSNYIKITTAFDTATTGSKELKECYRRTLINIYNKQHDKIKVNCIGINESRQLLVQRQYP
jgi:hypothetical protein